MHTDLRAVAHANVLGRVFDLCGRGLSKSLAEDILSLGFSDRDADRIAELNAKANEGSLSDREEAELAAYANVGDLLAHWQSKVRCDLGQSH